MPGQSSDDSLFVRVEGYKVILQDLEAVRQIIENMKEAVAVMNQVDAVKEQSIETFLHNVDRLNEKLESIEAEMPQMQDMQGGGSVQIEPQGTHPQGHDTRPQQPTQDDPEEAVDDTMQELESELKGLQDELENLE